MRRAGRVVLVILVLAAGPLMLAQNSAIQGVITDPSAAPVPNVSITITNVDTGVATTVQSNERGFYSAPFLPTGTYKVEAVGKAAKEMLARGWLTAFLRQRISRQRNHEAPKSGIPKRKKSETCPPHSCKIEYLLRSNHSDLSIASEFFTDDFERTDPAWNRE